MSDDKAQQEPSMEDILASIRRILSEDDAEEAMKTAAPTPAPAPAPAKAAPPPKPEPEPEPEPEVSFEPEPEPEPEPVPEFESILETVDESDEDVLELTDEMVAEEEPEAEVPEFEPEPEPFRFEPDPAPRAAGPSVEDSILAPPVQQASASAIAELARAVVRDRGVGLGNGGLTIEELVREILKPLIKDWLDQNLPYMIERIVKKEIERMVNRAESL